MSKYAYELLRGRHGRVEDGKNKLYNPARPGKRGDTIMLTREEARSFGDRVRFIPDQLDGEGHALVEKTVVVTEVPTDEVLDEPPSGEYDYLSDLNWREAVEIVKSLDTEKDLAMAHDAEYLGKRRKSVLDAIQTAISQL